MQTVQTHQSKADVRFFVHTVGKTPGQIIRDYISIRYERWLDYSRYKCAKQHMDEFAIELLDDVLLNLLQRDEHFLLKMYNQKKVQKGVEYTELDFFILRAIDLNTTSETAPFRNKNKPIKADLGVKLERLKIVEEDCNQIDRSAEILKQTKLVRWVFNGLNLTVFEHHVFEHKFFLNESLEEMEWSANKRIKYSLYNDVLSVIHNILYYYGLTSLKPKQELNDRQNEICTQFIRTHKVKTSKSIQ